MFCWSWRGRLSRAIDVDSWPVLVTQNIYGHGPDVILSRIIIITSTEGLLGSDSSGWKSRGNKPPDRGGGVFSGKIGLPLHSTVLGEALTITAGRRVAAA